MDMDGGQVTTWEADRAEGQVILCPFQQALLGTVPSYTAEAGRRVSSSPRQLGL